jgi:FKBP-type peptidyl-prolyl cis-trans isomerase FkpA
MHRIIMIALFTLLSMPAFAADEPKSDEQKTLYAVGLAVAKQVSVFNLTPAEFEIVKQGIIDGATGKTPLVDLEAYSQKIQALALARRDAQGEKLATMAKDFVDKAAKEKGAVKTSSGLIYLSLKEGSGTGPAATDKVKVNYRGTLVNGKEFDSSYKRGQPVELPLNPGGKARLICPPEISYGEQGVGLVPPNATLVFEIELLEVKK